MAYSAAGDALSGLSHFDKSRNMYRKGLRLVPGDKQLEEKYEDSRFKAALSPTLIKTVL